MKINCTINRLHLIIIFIGIIQWAKALPKCPTYQQNFMKILGFRPNIDYNSFYPLVRENIDNNTNSINLECWRACYFDVECDSYVLFLTRNECHGFTTNRRKQKYVYLPERYELISDPNSVFFEKTCLNIPGMCRTKYWPVVRIPGSTLVDQGYKTILRLVTRQRCVELCIFENEFNCLSASFVVSHKNNMARGEPIYDHINQELDELGQCTLSREDKTTRPDSFRISTIDEEYFENQCVERAPANVFCSFEQYSDSSFIYSEFELTSLSDRECQERCTLENRFYCMGVTYRKIGWESYCNFHSEDTISLGPRAVYGAPEAIYMRRVKCLNVTVLCGKNEMTVEYKPNHWFQGRMYVNSHSEECAIEGQGNNSTVLRIPVGDEIQESKCGIIRAYTKQDPFNRTLISTLIVIQKNSYIQTQGDRLIRVGCIINNNYSPDGVPDDIALGSSIEFSQSPPPNSGSKVVNETGEFPKVIMKIIDLNNQFEIKDAQLGENLEFILEVQPPNTNYDIRAINIYATSNNNETRIQLIDEHECPRDTKVFPALKKYRTPNAHRLRTRFHAFKFADAPGVKFYVQIHFCVFECPPMVCDDAAYLNGSRRKRQTSVKIVNNPSTLGPVRFPSRPIIFPNDPNYIKREVEPSNNDVGNLTNRNQTELDETPNKIYQSVISSYTNTTDGEQLAIVAQTTRNNFTDFKRILRNDDNLTLNTTINVHSNKVGETESLIYGENSQILVSGIDFERDSNMLCVTPGVIVLILALWLLVQVILMTGCCILIKKYRKLAELEEDRRSLHRIHQTLDTDSLNRRVRFADQGSSIHSQIVFAT